MKKNSLFLIAIVLGCISINSCASPTTAANPAAPAASSDDALKKAFNTVDTTLSLWAIQPGLGTVMIEYAKRFSNIWFASQANNWSMVKYQIKEMREIQEVAETTRPGRKAMLKDFETSFIDPLDKGADVKDLAAFTVTYDKAINGCNSCHKASTASATDKSTFQYVKVKRPDSSEYTNIDWAGQ